MSNSLRVPIGKIYIVVITLTISAFASPAHADFRGLFQSFRQTCARLLSTAPASEKRTSTLLSPNSFSRYKPKPLIKEYLLVESSPSYGVRRAFGTAVYYLRSGAAREDFPEIGTGDVAVVFALGGSGAETASGRAFLRNAASLKKYGISLISIDYPFHADGPREKRFKNSQVFLTWLEQIVAHYERAGLPVFLFGHSFGSIVIQELLYRQSLLPQSERLKIAGSFLTSFGGNASAKMLAHYQAFRYSDRWEQYLTKEKIGMNQGAEVWAEGPRGDGGINGGFQSIKTLSPIETSAPVTLISAKSDEWSTPELLEEIADRFPNGSLELVENANHVSILSVKEGKDGLMTGRIVSAVKSATGTSVTSRKVKVPDSEILQGLRGNSELFRKWFDKSKWGKAQVSDSQAREVMEAFKFSLRRDIIDLAKFNLHILERFFQPVRGDLPIFLISEDGDRFNNRSVPQQLADPLLKEMNRVRILIDRISDTLTQQEIHTLMRFDRIDTDGGPQSMSSALKIYIDLRRD